MEHAPFVQRGATNVIHERRRRAANTTACGLVVTRGWKRLENSDGKVACSRCLSRHLLPSEVIAKLPDPAASLSRIR